MRSTAIADLEDTIQRFSSARRSNNSRLAPSSMSSGSGLSPSSNHGIHTIPKGDCAGCGQSIIGQIVIAMGKSWHPEHYVCSNCGQELGRQSYFEKGGKAYCENDYFELFSPRCAFCNGPIRDKCVHALNKTFHLEHFSCVECGKNFGQEGFHEKDGMPYCRSDYLRLFGPKCKGCKNPVKSRFITALGATWDPECFCCTDCSRPFNDGIFFTINGSPLCETHYHERRGSVCSQCNLPIHGRCVVALNKRFHPEHFTCNNCRHPVTRTTYKEVSGKAYCQRCYEKMQEFTVEEVAKHNSKESAWIIIRKKVYDITNFLNEHPGGDLLLLDRSGQDATIEFEGQEHSSDAKEILKEKLIGRLKID